MVRVKFGQDEIFFFQGDAAVTIMYFAE
jgi:hypothetical protein